MKGEMRVVRTWQAAALVAAAIAVGTLPAGAQADVQSVVSAAFGAMLEEVAAPDEGAMALTSALMKACLVVLLRRHLQSSRQPRQRLPS